MDAEAVRSLVAERYGLGTPTRVELLTKGQNDTYVVQTTDDRYVFRVYGSGKPWIRGDDDLRFELDLLTHLHTHQAPVSHPLPTRDGSTLGQISTSAGGRRCALFTWAHGQPIDSEHWAPKAASRLGHALATIHVAADSFTTTRSRYRLDVSTLLDRSMERMR
ncbi:MAG: phosphotransferase, partial [Microlunatus sp.]